MSSDTEERCRAKRDQDQVAGVGRDTGKPADEDDDEGQRPARCCFHQAANQGCHQANLLGNTNTDHRNENHRHHVEAGEVVHERREDKPQTVDRDQVFDFDRLGDDHIFVVDPVNNGDWLGTPTKPVGLGFNRNRYDDILGDAYPDET